MIPMEEPYTPQDPNTPDFPQQIINDFTGLLRKHSPEPQLNEELYPPDASTTPQTATGIARIAEELGKLANTLAEVPAQGGLGCIQAANRLLVRLQLQDVRSQLVQELELLRLIIEIGECANNLYDSDRSPGWTIFRIGGMVEYFFQRYEIPEQSWSKELEAITAMLELTITTPAQ